MLPAGLSGDLADLQRRREQFGSNYIEPKPPKAFLWLVWEALKNCILIILIVIAVISLGFSFYQSSGEDVDIGGKGFCHLLSDAMILEKV